MIWNKLAPMVLLLILVMSGFLYLPTGFAQTVPQCNSNSIFRMTLQEPPDSLNGLTAATLTGFQLAQIMMRNTFPLPYPNGAPDWMTSAINYSSNSNYTVWYYKVLPGLKWSNGQNVTANDILTTFGPSFGLNSTYDFAGLSSYIKNEYALNTSTAVFVLNQSEAHWPELTSFLYYIPIYPAAVIQRDGAASNLWDTWTDGPFWVDNYTPGAFQMVLYRNPYFKPLPNICEVDANFVDSLSLTTSYIESGKTDFAPIEPADVGAALKNPNIHVYTQPNEDVGLQLNVTVYPYNMTAFRQALAYGINQSAIIDQAFYGYGITAYSSEGEIAPINTAWYDHKQVNYSFDQTHALSLLSSIGITKGSDGFLQYPGANGKPNGTDVSLDLWADTDQTYDVVASQVVQQDLQQLGFKIHTVTTSISNIIADSHSNLNNEQHAMVLYTQFGVNLASAWLMTLPGWATTWLSTLPQSSGYWEYPPNINAQYESNYTAFSSTNDPSQALKYSYNIQEINAQNLPMIFLGYGDYLWAYNTQNWMGWPSCSYCNMYTGESTFNISGFANLAPTNGVSSSAASSNTNAASTTSSSGASSISTSSSTSSTSTTSSTGLTDLSSYAVASMATLVAVSVGVTFARRKRT